MRAMNESVVTFLMMLLLGSGQTFLTLRSIRQVEINLSKNQNYSNLVPKSTVSFSSPAEAITNEYICIEVSPNLPPCNFNKIHSSIEEDDSLTKIHAKRKRQVDIPKSLIVYKIEGCIPSRLPFRLPFCKPEESRSPLAKIQNLRPFKTKEIYKNAPNVFPIFNHTQWLEQMKHNQLEHEIQSQSEVKHNFSHTLEFSNENRSKQRREIESVKSIKRKNWLKTEDEESHKKKKKILNMRKTIHKTQKRIEEDIQEARGLDQELDKLVAELEFPYSRAIPFDPEKLQVAQIGSEFPYSQAIPFDAEKLQVAKERSVYPYWKAILYRPDNNYQFPSNFHDFDYSNDISYENNFLYPKRNHHSRKLQSLQSNEAVSTNSLESVKEDGKFSYEKQISRIYDSPSIIGDSESLGKNSRLNSHNWEREKKTKVLQRESNYHYRPLKNIRKGHKFLYTKAISNNLKELESASVSEEGHYAKQPRYLSRNLRFIKEGSEFPYTQAIPFDPEKLAVAAARKSNLSKQVFHSKLLTNTKEYISRKPLAFNAGNNLSPLLFVPHSRRTSIHHSKTQRGKSS